LKDDVTAIILAGGAGKRFGGQDKGLIEWRGKPLVAHSIELLAPQVNHVIVSCNRNQEQYARYCANLVRDRRADHQGPLAGIEAGLMACKTRYALIYTCDQLAVFTNLAEVLYLARNTKNVDIMSMRDFDRIYFLNAMMEVALLPSLQSYLDGGARKVQGWYQQHSHDTVMSPRLISNINTQRDLEVLAG